MNVYPIHRYLPLAVLVVLCSWSAQANAQFSDSGSAPLLSADPLQFDSYAIGAATASEEAAFSPSRRGRTGVPLRREIEPSRLFVLDLPSGTSSAARPRAVYYAAGGALIGAALGVAVRFRPVDCRSGESMCGLAVPLYGGAGAVGGALIGYIIGSSNR